MTEGSVSLARHPPAPNQTGPAEQPRTTRSPVAPALVLGVGLGGFVDGIVLHQILQWHHMLTATDSYPATTVNGLETNTLADGLFHASTWVFVAVGSALLVRAWRRGRMAPPWRLHVGLLLTGWGLFNVIEGLVDHHLLRIHHVRDDVADPHWWDLGFLGFGAALLVVGLLLAGSSRPLPPGLSPSKPSDDHGPRGAETVATTDLRLSAGLHNPRRLQQRGHPTRRTSGHPRASEDRISDLSAVQ